MGSAKVILADNLDDLATEFEATVDVMSNPSWTDYFATNDALLATMDYGGLVGTATLSEIRTLNTAVDDLAKDDGDAATYGFFEVVDKLLNVQTEISDLQGVSDKTLSDVVTAISDSSSSSDLSALGEKIDALKGSGNNTATLYDVAQAIASQSDDDGSTTDDLDDADYTDSSVDLSVADDSYSTDGTDSESTNAQSSITNNVSYTDDDGSCDESDGVSSFYCALGKIFYPPGKSEVVNASNATINNTLDWACPDFSDWEGIQKGFLDTTWLDLSAGSYQFCLGGSETAAIAIVAFIYALTLLGSLYVGFGIAFG